MSRTELSELNSMIIAFQLYNCLNLDFLLMVYCVNRCLKSVKYPCNTEKNLTYLYQFHMIYKSIPRYQRNNAFCFVLVELQSFQFYSKSRGSHSGHYGSKFKH